jgi:hypothetical protein
MRIYSFFELCKLLELSGFGDPQGFDTLTGKPFALGAQRLSFVATKLPSE